MALPIPCYVAEQPLFDFVPFASAGREMADFDFQPGVVTQLLQLDLPKATATAVAAPPVGGDQQACCLSMTTAAQSFPPTPNRGDCKLGRVAADTDTDPRFVVPQIIDAVRNRLAFARIGKVMRIDFPRLDRKSVV